MFIFESDETFRIDILSHCLLFEGDIKIVALLYMMESIFHEKVIYNPIYLKQKSAFPDNSVALSLDLFQI